MVCKICGTRLGSGEQTCPNCGHETKSSVKEGDRTKEKDTGRSRRAMPPAGVGDPELGEGAGPEKSEVEQEGEDSMPAPKASDPTLPVVALDPAGLRRLLAKHPEYLEPGLTVYTDEKGKAVGAQYASGVGDIDLLARDESGGLVVVRVADRGQGEELVSETLQRIGWVRKHLGKGKQKVRGIVLVEQSPDNLSYTASAVAGTIAFKTYRVAVAFEEVEI